MQKTVIDLTVLVGKISSRPPLFFWVWETQTTNPNARSGINKN